MLETMSETEQKAAGDLFHGLFMALARETGENRPFPAQPEDDPLFWDLGTYPKTVELLHDLVAEYC